MVKFDGNNRETAKGKVGYVLQKTRGFARHSRVFPWDSVEFYFHFLGDGLRLVAEK